MRRILFAATAAALLAIATPAFAFDAVVLACRDGDTCTVVTGDKRIHVRLHGVDSPEIVQPYGTAARDLIVQLIVGHHVDVRPDGSHNYNRMGIWCASGSSATDRKSAVPLLL